MDVESDDSTWEDLFGSSTDLGTSIFKHYEDLKKNGSATSSSPNETNLKSTESLGRRLAKSQIKQHLNEQQQSQHLSQVNHANTANDDCDGNNGDDAIKSEPVISATTSTTTATSIESIKNPFIKDNFRRLITTTTSTSTTITSPSATTATTTSAKTNEINPNYRMLSPNVKRILTNTSESVDDLNLSVKTKTKFERQNAVRSSHNSTLKHTKLHNTTFPLSKNLSKYAKSQSEECIGQIAMDDGNSTTASSDNNDSNNNYNSCNKLTDVVAAGIVHSQPSPDIVTTTAFRKISLPTPPRTPDAFLGAGAGLTTIVDDDKTPTNNLNNNFLYGASTINKLIQNINSINSNYNNNQNSSDISSRSSSNKDDNSVTSDSNKVKSLIQQLNRTSEPQEQSISNSSSSESGRLLATERMPLHRRSVLMDRKGSSSVSTQPKRNDTDSSDENFVECFNENVKLPSGFDKSKLGISKSVIETRNQLVRLASGEKLISKSPPSATELAPAENQIKLNIKDTTSTPQPANGNDTSNLSPVLSSKASSKSSLNSDAVILPPHNRRLSNISISSTSSSSSSGSDNLNLTSSKLTTTYLASIESLADHSEGEIMSNTIHKNLTMCERAVMEIAESERNYVEDIGQVITGYLNDWRDNGCLKVDELKKLFSNIQEIYHFNSILLKRINESGRDPAKIAQCFIDLKDDFEVYTVYCTSYPESISQLSKLLRSTHTNSLLSSTQRLLNHTLPLGSYLLKPVQRILKYHLLLDNLRKHSNLPEITKAHEIMEKVASHIDHVKKKLEQQSRVKELSGILDGWLGPDLSVLGELLLEGFVFENNKPRMLFLFQSMLIITKPKEDKRLQHKTFISCKNLMLIEHFAGEPKNFQVVPFSNPKGQIKFTAQSVSQKRLWAHQIKEAMLEHFNIPKRAQELVYKLGDEEDRTGDNKNSSRKNSNTSSTPDYLERRHQFRRSEMRVRNKKSRKNSTASLILDNFVSSNHKEIKKVESPTFVSYSKDLKLCQCDTDCNCKQVKTQLNDTIGQQQQQQQKQHDEQDEQERQQQQAPLQNEQLNKSRSKSESRLPEEFSPSGMNAIKGKQKAFETKSMSKTADDLYKYSTLGRPKSKSVDIKMYNTKTLPKRITTIKKNKVRKETSKFYTDLPSDTVLKITESTDDISDKSREDRSLSLPASEAPPIYLHQQTQEQFKQQQQELAQQVQQQLQQVNLKRTATEKAVTPKSPKDEPAADVNEDDNNNNHNSSNNTIEKYHSLIKKDAEIISQLIMERNKEFNKILNKPPKKKSIDYTVDKLNIISSTTSPQKVDVETADAKDDTNELDLEDMVMSRSTLILNRLNDIQNTIRTPEPIYETLLRNVHVPYKFAPALNRSISQPATPRNRVNQDSLICKESLAADPKSQRPESDYVTLTYTEEGDLLTVNEEDIYAEISQMHHTSDSQINYNNAKDNVDDSVQSEEIDKDLLDNTIDTKSEILKTGTSTVNVFERKGSFNLKASPRALLQRFMSVRSNELESVPKSRARKSVDNYLGGATDSSQELIPGDVQRYGILYKQGSENLGSRIAHVDYCDPKTLFQHNALSNSNIFINMQSVKSQRDSVLSSTSSSDSINDTAKVTTSGAATPPAYNNGRTDGNAADLDADSYYEKDVEASLENDFRDSAVYSDDNDKKLEYFDGLSHCVPQLGSCKKEPPKVPKKPTANAPPVPAKPPKLIMAVEEQTRCLQSQEQLNNSGECETTSSTVREKTSSWVLRQIRKFE